MTGRGRLSRDGSDGMVVNGYGRRSIAVGKFGYMWLVPLSPRSH